MIGIKIPGRTKPSGINFFLNVLFTAESQPPAHRAYAPVGEPPEFGIWGQVYV
jgi:hypothetical protein